MAKNNVQFLHACVKSDLPGTDWHWPDTPLCCASVNGFRSTRMLACLLDSLVNSYNVFILRVCVCVRVHSTKWKKKGKRGGSGNRLNSADVRTDERSHHGPLSSFSWDFFIILS